MTHSKWHNGWWLQARAAPSPHFDARPDPNDISLLVIHNISLPPGEFTGDAVERFFLGQLSAHEHPYFATIATLRVSSHFFIRRNGDVVQFVAADDRAWHAGVSSFQQRERCNDFSLGVELEGSDEQAFEPEQYTSLVTITRALQARYPAITLERITGHQHIAPQRKTDPGPFFDWDAYRRMLFQTQTR